MSDRTTKNIAIIGTGLSAMSSIEALKNNKDYKITVFESGGKYKNKIQNKKNDFKSSFKYNSSLFKSSKEKFLKNYNIKEKNFFLTNVNCYGGLSNFWGGGIEIPNKSFLIKNKLPVGLLKNIPYIKKIFRIEATSSNKIKKLRKSSSYKNIDNLEEKNFKINNIDISLGGNKTLNTKLFFDNLVKNKKINLYLNHHVEKIIKKNDKYYLSIKNINKKISKRFDIIILCAGTVGSTLMILKYLNLQNLKVRFANNPMMQLCFYKPNLYLNKNDNVKFSHPLKNFHQKIGVFENKGSLIPLKFFENYHLGYSNNNFLINFIKKGIIAGNVFFDSRLTKNFISIKKDKPIISFDNNIKKIGILNKTKIKIKNVFNKINFFSVPIMNFKTYVAGSDSHYTSSLMNLNINKRKIIKKNCELKNNKNFFILDGSVVPEGTFYPSFLIALNAYYYAKKIVGKN